MDSNLLHFSECSDTQLIFHNLSSKVMEVAFKKMKKLLTATFSKCQSDWAWTNPGSNAYKECTEEISESNDQIIDKLDHIQNFAIHNLDAEIPIDIQIGQVLEGINPLDSNGVGIALKFIQEASYKYERKLSCECSYQ